MRINIDVIDDYFYLIHINDQDLLEFLENRSNKHEWENYQTYIANKKLIEKIEYLNITVDYIINMFTRINGRDI
jgi:hypothetical protein